MAGVAIAASLKPGNILPTRPITLSKTDHTRSKVLIIQGPSTLTVRKLPK